MIQAKAYPYGKNPNFRTPAVAAESAVAGGTAFAAETPVAAGYENESDEDISGAGSIAGDSIAESQCEDDPTAVAAMRQASAAPKTPQQGERGYENHGRPSKTPWIHNEDPNVGNVGIFFGNWGIFGDGGDAAKKARRIIQDRQLMNCPAQLIVLAEATPAVEELLRLPGIPGKPHADDHSQPPGLTQRESFEHYVVRGDEPVTALLVAARTNTCSGIALLEYNVDCDHEYTVKKKQKQARSRTMVCEVAFKQNVGHLGKNIVVAGHHGHNHTMKFMWPEVHKQHFDLLAMRIGKYRIKFLCADFNMSVTEVTKQLRSRGIKCDCCAWYPWIHATTEVNGQALGFDSCAIFFIGGDVSIKMQWDLSRLHILTAVAGTPEREELEKEMDMYDTLNKPGQHWSCYHSKNFYEPVDEKNLTERLVDLLTVSTEPWQLPMKSASMNFCPHLRLVQKQLDNEEWLVKDCDLDVTMHNGAHFPLCAFTKNASARSRNAAAKRSQRAMSQWTQSLQRAVAQWTPPSAVADNSAAAVAENMPWQDPWQDWQHWQASERSSFWQASSSSESLLLPQLFQQNDG